MRRRWRRRMKENKEGYEAEERGVGEERGEGGE